VIALWLASKLLTTKDAVRLALDDLGAVGSLLGYWDKGFFNSGSNVLLCATALLVRPAILRRL
jgi:hypothetical protein